MKRNRTPRRMLSLLLAVVLATGLCGGLAMAEEDDIKGDFTDPNFLAAVYELIGKTDGDPIYASELEGISYLYIPEKGIASLAGLEHFPNLTSLQCDYNQLTNIPELPNSLEVLACSKNQLTELPVLPNGLTVLYCAFNPLGELPILPQNLQSFDCSQNGLKALPPLPSTLGILHCAYNQLTSLDVPELPNSLKVLDCSNNQLTELPVLPNGLTHLSCAFNPLGELPPLPQNLQFLECSGNGLKALPPLPTSLEILYCLQNQLTSIDVSNTSLHILWCFSNRMTSPNKVIGWEDLGLVINTPYDTSSGNFLYYSQSVPQGNELMLTTSFVAAPRPGDFFTIDVSILNNPGIKSFNLSLDYDESKLDYVSTDTAYLDGLGTAIQGGDTGDKITLAWISNGGLPGDDCTLFSVVFKVKDDTPDGTYPIALSGYVTDQSAKLDAVLMNGAVFVLNYMLGDVNGDGEIDMLDAVLLQAIWLGDHSPSTREFKAADVNCDGKVDANDLILLMQYIVGGYGIVLD